jgi:hypothetical protein
MAVAPNIIVLLPVYNDWDALALLLPKLVDELKAEPETIGILVVDDGSVDLVPPALARIPLEPVLWLRVLRLRRNLGHQRAIATGLCYVYEHLPCDAVVVLDADGEDRPEDIPRLLERHRRNGDAVVFAERRRRGEGLTFRLFYQLYRAFHLVLTGTRVRVGNFSVIPRRRLEGLIVVSELWNHYAAAVLRSRQPWCAVPTVRGKRLDGRSSMNFISLVVHGLSAISVQTDVVLTRLVVAVIALIGALLATLLTIAVVTLFFDVAVPGWTTAMAGVIVILLAQTVSLIAILAFLTLGARHQTATIPLRDYGPYVGSVEELHDRADMAS